MRPGVASVPSTTKCRMRKKTQLLQESLVFLGFRPQKKLLENQAHRFLLHCMVMSWSSSCQWLVNIISSLDPFPGPLSKYLPNIFIQKLRLLFRLRTSKMDIIFWPSPEPDRTCYCLSLIILSPHTCNCRLPFSPPLNAVVLSVRPTVTLVLCLVPLVVCALQGQSWGQWVETAGRQVCLHIRNTLSC